jgi:hypothetical protein
MLAAPAYGAAMFIKEKKNIGWSKNPNQTAFLRS